MPGSGVCEEVTRRQVLTRGAALGLGIPLAGGFLEACSSSPTGIGGGSSKGIVVGLDTDIDTLDPRARGDSCTAGSVRSPGCRC